MVAASTPAHLVLEYSGLCFDAEEDFSKLHEDFGKEIRKLISDWKNRGDGQAVLEESLIDFG